MLNCAPMLERPETLLDLTGAHVLLINMTSHSADLVPLGTHAMISHRSNLTADAEVERIDGVSPATKREEARETMINNWK